jgi:hypothetical protein
MQKVEGSSPFIRLQPKARISGPFLLSRRGGRDVAARYGPGGRTATVNLALIAFGGTPLVAITL